jgi:hypothetical protein
MGKTILSINTVYTHYTKKTNNLATKIILNIIEQFNQSITFFNDYSSSSNN